MSRMITQALKTIESHKATGFCCNELLDILGDVLLLRLKQRKNLDITLFPVEERLVKAKLRGGFPLVDLSQLDFIDLARPREYFLGLLRLAQAKGHPAAAELEREILDGTLDFRELLTGAIEPEASDDDDPGNEQSIASFGMLDFLLDECLRPELERVAEKYAPVINDIGWSEGSCPVCGEEPKIGEFKTDDTCQLFCYQCGFRWSFDPMRCPFCGNEEGQSLSYFTVEGEEKYRVDVCHKCNRYIKMVDFRHLTEPANLDVEDIATLHLDVLAYEEGYN